MNGNTFSWSLLQKRKKRVRERERERERKRESEKERKDAKMNKHKTDPPLFC